MKKFLFFVALLSSLFATAQNGKYRGNKCFVSKKAVMQIITKVNKTYQDLHPDHDLYYWRSAVYHIGNMAAYHTTQNPDFLKFSIGWAARNYWCGASGRDKTRWRYDCGFDPQYVLFGDNQACFQVYVDIFETEGGTDSSKIARALEVMDYQIKTPQSDYWFWADASFMVMPLMPRLYAITGDSLYLTKMYDYWRWTTNLLCDKDSTYLYYRDRNYIYPRHQTPSGKKDFWARGNGWMFAALSMVISQIPETDSHRAEYIKYFVNMASSLKNCQQPEGHWTRSLLDGDYVPGYETSGTAFFAFGLACGINCGVLERSQYAGTLQKAWKYLTEIALQDDNTIGYIQPVGERAQRGQTLSEANYYDFGVGAYLLMLSEMYKMAK